MGDWQSAGFETPPPTTQPQGLGLIEQGRMMTVDNCKALERPRVKDSHTYSVCPDCYLASAGYVSEVYEQIAENSGGFTADCWRENFETRTAEWTDLVNGDEDTRHFSWSPCDLCDGLAGDRWDILALALG